MLPMIRTPWGEIELYYAAQTAGAIVSVLVQMVLLYRAFRNFRSLWFAPLYGLYSWLGGLAGSLIRVLSYTSFEGTLWENVTGNYGKHFIGTVLVAAVLAVPCIWLLHKILYQGRRDWKKDMTPVTNSLAVGILIQHIFGRLGCFARGCCYGIPSNGIFSMTFPYASVSYSVFPSQLFEMIGTVLLLLITVWFVCRKKAVFGGVICGFSCLIFLSEFLMDKRGTTMYYHLTVIQWFAVLLFCLGIVHLILFWRQNTRDVHSRR